MPRLADGFKGLYLWVRRQEWFRDQFEKCWPRFLCHVLGFAYPEEARRFTANTYAADGTYLLEPLELTQFEKEFIDGLMLGDGCITVDARNPQRRTATVRMTSKHASVAEWVADSLQVLGGGIHQRVETLRYQTGNGEVRKASCPKAIYYSRSSPQLLSLAERWYASDGENRRKIVPMDLQLTPTVMHAWYIGDGGASYSRHGRASLRLSTHSFSHEEVRRLCMLIRGAGIGCSIDGVWRSDTQWTLRVPASQASAFLRHIGPPPVEELAHRWQLTRPA